jgi:hypothetical protein
MAEREETPSEQEELDEVETAQDDLDTTQPFYVVDSDGADSSTSSP